LDGKGGRYAMPFCGVIRVMEVIPRRGVVVYNRKKEKKEKEVKAV